MRGFAILLLTALAATAGEPPWREGDIVFQTSRSSQSRAIQLATNSRWSHMGMVVREHGRWMVFEAVEPVKLTPIESWIARGVGGHAVGKRLRRPEERLTQETRDRIRKLGREFLGRHYDLTFEWDDRRMYCSELVWKLFKRGAGIEIGRLGRLEAFDLSHPIVKRKMQERYGGRVPKDMPVISPAAMFDSPEIEEAWRR